MNQPDNNVDVAPDLNPDRSQTGTAAVDSNKVACDETILSPRFYTTDFEAMNRLDINSVRGEWDQMMAEFKADVNRHHFERSTGDFASEVKQLEEPLYSEFVDFLISSATSEFSGCILYSDIMRNVENKDIKELMSMMARDESRHAGFINKSLKDFEIGLDLGFLRKAKKYTFFRPKFIFYATYLSEKIGYARYITIFREFERHPERRFHPIFRWFESWCNDEFRHGEAFALIMRAQPELLRGHNKLWIRFFLLAVFATMYVRDHSRPAMHKAFGIDPSDYGFRVFRITSEVSKQVFPFTLDIDNPKFLKGLEQLRKIGQQSQLARQRGGLIGNLQRGWLAVNGVVTFAKLYLLPVIDNQMPEKVRMQAAW